MLSTSLMSLNAMAVVMVGFIPIKGVMKIIMGGDVCDMLRIFGYDSLASISDLTLGRILYVLDKTRAMCHCSKMKCLWFVILTSDEQ